jgi:hypothetical protein
MDRAKEMRNFEDKVPELLRICFQFQVFHNLENLTSCYEMCASGALTFFSF